MPETIVLTISAIVGAGPKLKEKPHARGRRVRQDQRRRPEHRDPRRRDPAGRHRRRQAPHRQVERLRPRPQVHGQRPLGGSRPRPAARADRNRLGGPVHRGAREARLRQPDRRGRADRDPRRPRRDPAPPVTRSSRRLRACTVDLPRRLHRRSPERRPHDHGRRDFDRRLRRPYGSRAGERAVHVYELRRLRTALRRAHAAQRSPVCCPRLLQQRRPPGDRRSPLRGRRRPRQRDDRRERTSAPRRQPGLVGERAAGAGGVRDGPRVARPRRPVGAGVPRHHGGRPLQPDRARHGAGRRDRGVPKRHRCRQPSPDRHVAREPVSACCHERSAGLPEPNASPAGPGRGHLGPDSVPVGRHRRARARTATLSPRRRSRAGATRRGCSRSKRRTSSTCS